MTWTDGLRPARSILGTAACALALAAPAALHAQTAPADSRLSADTAVLRTGAPLTLADVVSLALQNNPQTRVAYAQARAATAAYESSRGRLVPRLNVTAPVARAHGVSSGGGSTDSTGAVRSGGSGDRTT